MRPVPQSAQQRREPVSSDAVTLPPVSWLESLRSSVLARPRSWQMGTHLTEPSVAVSLDTSHVSLSMVARVPDAEAPLPPVPEMTLPPVPEMALPPVPEMALPPVPEMALPPVPEMTLPPVAASAPVPRHLTPVSVEQPLPQLPPPSTAQLAPLPTPEVSPASLPLLPQVLVSVAPEIEESSTRVSVSEDLPPLTEAAQQPVSLPRLPQESRHLIPSRRLTGAAENTLGQVLAVYSSRRLQNLLAACGDPGTRRIIEELLRDRASEAPCAAHASP